MKTKCKSITQHIRDSINRNTIGYDRSYEMLIKSEWSCEFEKLMRNRLIQGAIRYGKIHEPAKPSFNNIGQAIKELSNYLEDGNMEHLVDAANLCLIEYERPRCHSKPHFIATDDIGHTNVLKERR
jgi:hypothetical protein